MVGPPLGSLTPSAQAADSTGLLSHMRPFEHFPLVPLQFSLWILPLEFFHWNRSIGSFSWIFSLEFPNWELPLGIVFFEFSHVRYHCLGAACGSPLIFVVASCHKPSLFPLPRVGIQTGENYSSRDSHCLNGLERLAHKPGVPTSGALGPRQPLLGLSIGAFGVDRPREAMRLVVWGRLQGGFKREGSKGRVAKFQFLGLLGIPHVFCCFYCRFDVFPPHGNAWSAGF